MLECGEIQAMTNSHEMPRERLFVRKYYLVGVLRHEIELPIAFSAQFIEYGSVCQNVDRVGTIPSLPKYCVVVGLVVKVFIPQRIGLYPANLRDVTLQIERKVLVIGVIACHLVIGLELGHDRGSEVLDRPALIKVTQTAVEDDQEKSRGQTER